jgi:hypothetical protein
LNSSLLFHYEVNYFNDQVEFDILETRKLLEFDMEHGVEKGEYSLLNFKNAAFLAANLEEPSKVSQHFDLGTDEAKGQALIDYYKGVMLAFS